MKATCHCGAVELRVTPGQPLDQATRCDCSFCRRRQAAAVMVPLADLELVRGQDVLTLYEWGTGTAKHYFCSVCGIYTHHRRRSDPRQYGVNLGCIDGANPRDHEPIRWTDGVNHVSDR